MKCPYCDHDLPNYARTCPFCLISMPRLEEKVHKGKQITILGKALHGIVTPAICLLAITGLLLLLNSGAALILFVFPLFIVIQSLLVIKDNSKYQGEFKIRRWLYALLSGFISFVIMFIWAMRHS